MAAGDSWIHFWLDDEASARAAVDWDPDRDPCLFASGVSHSIVELYARMRQRGHRVSIGPRIPDAASVVVWYPDDGDPRAQVARNWRAARLPQVLIRSDRALEWRPSCAPDFTVVPNEARFWRGFIDGPLQAIPHLPQRGLIPRHPDRFGQVSTVALKANPENLPGYLMDDSFSRRLEAIGFTLLLDVPTTSAGADQHWHDFSGVDISLCVRATTSLDRLACKPATKLINAWVAGSIPLVAPEPAYLELCEPGLDALVVEGPDSIIERLVQLRRDPHLVRQLETSALSRGRDYTVDGVMAQWERLLLESGWTKPTGWDVAARWVRSLPMPTARVLAGRRGRRLARSIRDRLAA